MFAPPQGPDALPATVRAPGPAHRDDAGESHVGLRPVPAASIDWLEAHDVLDELGDEQFAFGLGLSALDQSVALTPRTPKIEAAVAAVEAGVRDLAALRAALARVHIAAAERRVQRLFVADSPLTDYLRGVYAWAHATLRALEQLMTSLRADQTDWALVRWRIEEARNFYFDDLEGAIQKAVASLPDAKVTDDLASALDLLFDQAAMLDVHLEKRFA